MRAPIFLAPLSSIFLLACGGSSDLTAEAVIEARSMSTVSGLATFTAKDNTITMELTISGATPGMHGVHLHEVGDCSAADATSAKGHWNPGSRMHGNPGAGDHHYGDTGNVEIAADGTGKHTFVSTEWTLASTSTITEIQGRAVIFHEKVDDFMQPAGNAGARQGCGVVRIKQ
jgi:superoxide dismutase, Cu-Zn family